MNECYNKINKFTKDNGYSYSVERIIKDYLKYYINGYYVSHTMKHCIENLTTEIKTLVDERNKHHLITLNNCL